MDGISEQEKEIIKEFLRNYSNEDDGRFVRFLGENIERKDAIILARILLKRRLDLDRNISYYKKFVRVSTHNYTKKINYLFLGPWENQEWHLDLDLISPLTMLNTLDVERCSSNHSAKQILHLEQIKELRMQFTYIDKQTTEFPFFRLLPNLEKLKFLNMNGVEEEERGKIINDLRNHSAFRETLKELSIYGLSFNDQQITTLLLDVPFDFRKLSDLSLFKCNIVSFRKIANEIERRIGNDNDGTWQPSKCLQRLNIKKGNPVVQKFKKHRNEINAIVTYLNVHSGLYSISQPRRKLHSDIEHRLRLNHAGRNLLGGNPSTGKPPVAKELHAIMMERSYKNSDHVFVWCANQRPSKRKQDATGLYDLLRNVPFFKKEKRGTKRPRENAGWNLL